MNDNLFKLLFKNEKIKTFLYNDLFVEFNLIIPINLCFSKNNLNNKTRELNFLKVKNIVIKFLNEFKIYATQLKSLFCELTIFKIIDHIIVAYLYYLKDTFAKLKSIDIFTSKYSVIYNKFNYFLTF